MIIDKLSHIEKYAGLRSATAGLIAGFAAQVNTSTEIRKYRLDEDRVFALVQEYAPRDFTTANVEIHRRYIDIHVPVYGDEMICYCPVDNLELIEDFTPQSDDLLYKLNPHTAIKLFVPPGSFVWFNHGEGHVPCLKCPSSPAIALKVVFKVDAALFNYSEHQVSHE